MEKINPSFLTPFLRSLLLFNSFLIRIRKCVQISFIFLLLLGAFSTTVQAEDLTSQALFLEFKGSIGPAQIGYLEAGLKRAQAEKAEVLVITLDTPGGQLQSTRTLVQMIESAPLPVVVFVYPSGGSATSAGALLALSASVIAMAPGTNMGSAHPVGGQGEEIKGVMGEKVANDTAAFARSMAEAHGRPVDIAEKIVSKSLNLSSNEALDKKLIDLIASDPQNLLKQLNGRTVKFAKSERKIILTDDHINGHQMSLSQKFLHFLANPNIATLLLSIGVFLIYAEMGAPGISFAGITGVLLLLLGFSAFQLLPIRTTGLALLVVGIVSLVAEFFVSTHGILLVGGLVSIILGFLYIIDPAAGNLKIAVELLIPVVLSLGIFSGIIVYSTSRTKKLLKKAREAMGGGAESGLAGYHGQVSSIEEDGFKGFFTIRGELWKFELIPSERNFKNLSVGDWVEVVEVSGLEAKVKRGKPS